MRGVDCVRLSSYVSCILAHTTSVAEEDVGAGGGESRRRLRFFVGHVDTLTDRGPHKAKDRPIRTTNTHTRHRQIDLQRMKQQRRRPLRPRAGGGDARPQSPISSIPAALLLQILLVLLRGPQPRGAEAAFAAPSLVPSRLPPKFEPLPPRPADAARPRVVLHDWTAQGLTPYQQAWAAQHAVLDRRLALRQEGGKQRTDPGWWAGDRLFLLQHPPTYTLGTGSTPDNLRFDPADAAGSPRRSSGRSAAGRRRGMGRGRWVVASVRSMTWLARCSAVLWSSLCKTYGHMAHSLHALHAAGTDRGLPAAGPAGRVPARPPLVRWVGLSFACLLRAAAAALPPVRPSLNLSIHSPIPSVASFTLSTCTHTPHRYLRALEEVVIRALKPLGVAAGREEGLTGVWTEKGKVAVRVWRRGLRGWGWGCKRRCHPPFVCA